MCSNHGNRFVMLMALGLKNGLAVINHIVYATVIMWFKKHILISIWMYIFCNFIFHFMINKTRFTVISYSNQWRR